MRASAPSFLTCPPPSPTAHGHLRSKVQRKKETWHVGKVLKLDNYTGTLQYAWRNKEVIVANTELNQAEGKSTSFNPRWNLTRTTRCSE